MSRDSRLNKFDRAVKRQALLDQKLHGEGLYVYKNHSKGELMLPKPTASGKRRVLAGEEFQGDNYFMQYVKNNMLVLVREIVSPQQQKKEKELATMQEQKLLLDQPDKVTAKGKVEQVVETKPAKPLNETKGRGKQSSPEVLINETGIDGVEIIN